MKRPVFASMAFLLAWLSLGMVKVAQAREFTNKEGQSMEAEITRVDGEYVIFSRDDKLFRYEIKQLVDEDQAYIAEWQKNVRVPENFSIRVKAEPRFLAKRRVNENGRKQSVENRVYDVRVTNETTTRVRGLVCYYQLFVKLNDKYADDRRSISKTLKGKKELGPLEYRGSVTFQTKPAMLTRGDNAIDEGNVIILQKWRESLDGANFHFYIGDELVATHYVGNYKDKGTDSPENEEDSEDEENS